MPVETRYMRSDQHTVNGLTAYKLLTSESASLIEIEVGWNTYMRIGIRVWKRTSGGVETEITGGVAVAVWHEPLGTSHTVTVSATWDCPETDLDPTDAILIGVYADVELASPTTLQAMFITEQLGADKLDAATWTVYYRLRRLRSGVAPYYTYTFYWRRGITGDSTYITNFTWTSVVPPPPAKPLINKPYINPILVNTPLVRILRFKKPRLVA